MRDNIKIDEIIQQINDIYLSIKSLKKNIKNIKSKNNKNEKSPDTKRPLNAYMIYYTENYKTIKENNLELPSKEIAKICGKNWKNMKSNEKNKYENKAKKNKEKYEKKQIHT